MVILQMSRRDARYILTYNDHSTIVRTCTAVDLPSTQAELEIWQHEA